MVPAVQTNDMTGSLRRVSFDMPVDPMLYSPLQLRPRAVLGWAIGGMARWFAEHMVPYPRLVHEHLTATVIGRVKLDYGLPTLRFHEADQVTVTASLRATGDGSWLRSDTAVTDGDRVVATVHIDLRAVTLSSGGDLGAVPGALPGPLLAKFRPDELFGRGEFLDVATPVAGPVLTAPVVREATLFRSQCEVADQWSFIEAIELVTQHRERLFLEHLAPPESLRRAVSAPVRSLGARFRRAMFSFDTGTVTSQAIDSPDGDSTATLFTHRVDTGRSATACLSVWEVLGDVTEVTSTG